MAVIYLETLSSLSVHTTSEGEAAEYFEELLQNNNNEIIHLFNGKRISL